MAKQNYVILDFWKNLNIEELKQISKGKSKNTALRDELRLDALDFTSNLVEKYKAFGNQKEAVTGFEDFKKLLSSKNITPIESDLNAFSALCLLFAINRVMLSKKEGCIFCSKNHERVASTLKDSFEDKQRTLGLFRSLQRMYETPFLKTHSLKAHSKLSKTEISKHIQNYIKGIKLISDSHKKLKIPSPIPTFFMLSNYGIHPGLSESDDDLNFKGFFDLERVLSDIAGEAQATLERYKGHYRSIKSPNWGKSSFLANTLYSGFLKQNYSPNCKTPDCRSDTYIRNLSRHYQWICALIFLGEDQHTQPMTSAEFNSLLSNKPNNFKHLILS